MHVPLKFTQDESGSASFGIRWRGPAQYGQPSTAVTTCLNARTDSLRRGSFKTMLANKRCVIPAEGFYEWREEHGKKQPYFFARKDGRPVMFARIWDYSDVKGEAVPSFAILTDEPNELVAPPLMGHSNDLIAVCQEKMKISPKQIWSCLLPKHVMAVDGALAATRPMNYD
jgi:hypothetical protein